jgi:two-component system NtrC family sensor kinase
MSGEFLRPWPTPGGREFPPIVETPAVLFVDDELLVRRTVQRTLFRDGFVVHLAESAREALAKLESGEIDVQVVVSDLMMPGMDGIAFLAIVRERWPRLQRMLLTASDEADKIQRAINEAGVHRFVHKPWEPPVLPATVRDCVEQWALLAERDRLQEITNRQNEALLSLTQELENKVQQRTVDLERASRDWRRTFDSIADPLTIVDGKLRIKRANTAVAHHAREDIRRIVGRRCHEVMFGRPEPCEGCPLAAGQVGEQSFDLADARNGREWRVTTWPLHDSDPENGDEGASVCHYEDVTERVALQKQMIALEKLAAIGELAGCVAHELNNPLTAITSFTQIMRRMVGGNADLETFTVDILESAQRCTKIVQSLLDFARGGPAAYAFMEVDVNQVVTGCLRLAELQPMARRGHLKFETRLPVDLWRVRGNPDALKSVFLNLINNAIQAMHGEGTLTVEAENVSAERAVRVRVSDTGPGVPDALMHKIFEPFFTTKAKNEGGTGLGLAIVAKEIRTHGGEITVENLAERGACFEVNLPAIVPHQEEK